MQIRFTQSELKSRKVWEFPTLYALQGSACNNLGTSHSFIPWGDQRILGDHLIFRGTERAIINKNLEDSEGSLKSAWTTPAV